MHFITAIDVSGNTEEGESATQSAVNAAANQTAQDVPDEEDRGDPRRAVEVDREALLVLAATALPSALICEVFSLAHHLRNGNTGEGDPAAHHGGAHGDGQGGEQLRDQRRAGSLSSLSAHGLVTAHTAAVMQALCSV